MTNKKSEVNKAPNSLKRIPNLRFPEFENVWEVKKLGDLMDFKVTNSFSRDNLNYDSGIVKNIHYGDIHTKFQTLFDITNEIVPFINEEMNIGKISDENYCKEGDIVFADASEDLNDVGKSIEIINLNGEKLLSGLHTLLARPIEGIFHLGFNGYLFKSNQVRIQIQKESQGSKVLSINVGRISKIELSFPSIQEQKKLTTLLSLIDTRIYTQSKIIRELIVLKDIVNKKIFLQELKFKNDDGNDFSEWQTKKLRDICEINPKNESLPNSFIYIDLESVANGHLLKEEWVSKDEAPSRAQRILTRNDVLFQMVRPYQKNNLLFDKEGEYVASTGYAQIRAKENSKYIFQYFHFQEFVDKVIERCTGTSYPAINSKDLSNIVISVPCLVEQTKIANFLSSIDSKIDIETQLLKKLEEQKKFLLQNLFV